MTPDQMFESFRQASASSLQMQSDMFKQWAQQLPWPVKGTGASVDWVQRLQARWVEFTGDLLSQQRASLDVTYKLAIQIMDQMSRLSATQSPEEQGRRMEEMRSKVFETFKQQSDAQLREFQKTAEKWFGGPSKD